MITTVRLPHNSIPDEGVAALVGCIAARPLITELNVSGNRMGSTGCKALVDMLGTRCVYGGSKGKRGRYQRPRICVCLI